MSDNVTAARPYARAVFEQAQADSSQGKWSEALGLMAAVAKDPTMKALLDSPRLGLEEKGAVFINVCEKKIDEKQQNLLKLLAQNRRLKVLPEIYDQYEALRTKAEGKLEAVVTSAFPLNQKQQDDIVTSLGKRLGCEVSLKTEIDESLIGGAVIRAGDMVIDGSIKAELRMLSNALNR